MKVKKTYIFLIVIAMLLWAPQAKAMSIENPGAIAANPSPGANTSVTFSFTTDSWLAAGGVNFTFPSGFNVSGVTAADASDENGNVGPLIVAGVAGQTVFTYRSGTGADNQNLTNADIKITIKNVVLPSQIGQTGTFLFTLGEFTPGWTVGAVETVPGLTISSPISLGSGSNHSKYCVVDAPQNTSFYMAVMAALFAIVLFGVKQQEKIIR